MGWLLVIIYVSFISLGLPDSLLGSAWPSMCEGLGVPISGAGLVSMLISGGTIVSSLAGGRVIRRFGVGPVTLASVAMTAAALLGFAFSRGYAALCLYAVPLGLGAGSVDAALNNFVALHYKARHMNWLHCFWGVGASLGPAVMAYCLVRHSWNAGYLAISGVQWVLVAVLFLSLPLWRRVRQARSQDSRAGNARQDVPPLSRLFRLPGARRTLFAFFCYCAIESTVGLWGSTYCVTVRSVPPETAARWIALFYCGITLGRLLAGFASAILRHGQIMGLGLLLIGGGTLILLLPLDAGFLPAGLFLIGAGCAPIYPSLLHETPNTFGRELSQAMMGVQMACAYIGTTFVPPFFGMLGAGMSYALFPWFVGALLAALALAAKPAAPGEGGGRRECQ